MADHWIIVALLLTYTSISPASSTCIFQSWPSPSTCYLHNLVFLPDFRVSPESVMAILESPVEFHCQPSIPTDIVSWIINTEPWSQVIPPNITEITSPDPSWNYSLSILQMPALLEYNNSNIQCVLIEHNFFSKTAVLIVKGEQMD